MMLDCENTAEFSTIADGRIFPAPERPVMPNPAFVHLRLHSEFSITDGIVRIDEAVERAAADRMPALAITDLANVFGMVKFYKAARAAGVKPVVGCDVWITNESERDKPHRLLLLAQSRVGYLRLSELLSRAWLDNQHRGRAEMRKAWFAGGSGGLIALSGALQGEVGGALLQDPARARQAASDWARLFPGRYYIELQRAGSPQTEHYIEAALRLAGECSLPVVATHPVQFLKPADFAAHEARVCIAEGYVLGDRRRPRAFTRESYFVSQAEMGKLFADIPEALANSVEIARRCNLALELGKSKLPVFPTPEGMTLEEYLRRQARQGLGRRLEANFGARAGEHRSKYEARLELELGTIIKMGFAGYFLIVADFINWAKSNGVPVGPGRGSGAGSLVAYSLGITDLDPLRYDLLFERFLNPERVSMPDFDIDFCERGRDRVIEYVKQKYGPQSVSQIATFGTMAARAVVRDVGRVMEWSYTRTDELAKLIPFQPGKRITLEDARRMEPRLAEREKSEEETRDLLALAGQLEGLARNVGMHAGGVLIAPGKLTDFCPLYAAQGTESTISQFDMKDVERIGLVKFDFLGLTTLTVLDWAAQSIRAMGDPGFALDKIPLDDAAAYQVFGNANTTAIFQFESRGMRDLIKRARPDRFEDIIALVALYRPGPMELIPEFVERKNGKRVEYLDTRLEPILKPTYGIMVYQEQVMQIAQVIGGYSLGGADLLRRAMGKKNAEEMAQQRDIFVAGAEKNKLPRAKAILLFDLMEKFAGYGFNKSHAAAYALIAYQTAYLKAHYGAAFMAANLSAVADDTDKVHQFHEDALANGLKVLPPDVNAGAYRFVPVDAKTIRYGLGAVKGTGEAAIAAILAARSQGGPFRDLFDFCSRVDKRAVNRRVVEALVRAGAFDFLDDGGAHRASLLASVGVALEAAGQAERNAMQSSLFGGESAAQHKPALVAAPRWTEAQRLREEKTALGFYLSGHPFAEHRAEIGKFVKANLKSVAASSEAEGMRTQLMAGVVEAIRFQRTQQGRMVIVNLSDGTATQEITVYNEVFDQYRDLMKEDTVIVVEAKVRSVRRSVGEEGEAVFTRITAERIYDLPGARSRFARAVRLSLNGQASSAGASSSAKLKSLLEPYRNGQCSVEVRYRNGGASVEMQLGDNWRVSLDDALLQSLSEWLRPENVEVVYP